MVAVTMPQMSIVTVTWPGDVVGGGGVILEDTMFDTPLQ